MESTNRNPKRWMAAAAAIGLMAAGCASNKDGGRAEGGDRARDGRMAADTAAQPGTGEEGGGGVGGSSPMDPGAPDTAGIYGDPNRWPTGPMPGDTGVGGAGSPTPDTAWMDTMPPTDPWGYPDPGREGTAPPAGGGAGGSGPDIF